MKIFRQGDVLIIEAKKSLKTSGYTEVPREDGGVVLAHGEVTGHRHQFRDPGVCLLSKEGISDRVLQIFDATALLVHEEHSTIEVPPGKYVVRIQRQWEGETSRKVED